MPRTVAALKKRFPELGVITDVALDPYTTHGHDGVIDRSGYVLNDETIAVLEQQALVNAAAGVDIVAPSDMMDGRIGAIRAALDSEGVHSHAHPGLLGEICFGLLRPVSRRRRLVERVGQQQQVQLPDGSGKQRRSAVGGRARPRGRRRHGDGQARHAVSRHRAPRERRIPASPTYVYQVSGEYAMLKAAIQNGWLDEKRCILEALLAFKRAGADGILTYFAIDAARWLKES